MKPVVLQKGAHEESCKNKLEPIARFSATESILYSDIWNEAQPSLATELYFTPL